MEWFWNYYLKLIAFLNNVNLKHPISFLFLQIADIFSNLNDLKLRDLPFVTHQQISVTRNKSNQVERSLIYIKNSTFLGEICCCFSFTSWCSREASFSQTWHFIYGTSSFLGVDDGFFAPSETGNNADEASKANVKAIRTRFIPTIEVRSFLFLVNFWESLGL